MPHTRERLPAITAGNVELVGAASSSVAIQPRHELSAVRHDIGPAHWRRVGHSADARRGAHSFDPIEEAARRPGHARPGRSFRPPGRPQAGLRAPESLSGAQRRPGICHLDRLWHYVDDMRSPFQRRISGFPDAVGRGVSRCPASKHPLQKRSRVGEPACAGEKGRLKHVAVSVVHLRSFLSSETSSSILARKPDPSPGWDSRARIDGVGGDA